MLRKNGRSLNDGRFASIECQHHADDDHRAENGLLKIGIDAYHVHAVIKRAKQKPAEQRVNGAAGTSGERRSADHHRGNRLQLKEQDALTGVRPA
jgi:hypothetical protein